MRDGGGSLFLGTNGAQIGPGHADIFKVGNQEWLSYHYYDATRAGQATLAVRPLRWTADGWPE
jgi:arabinan endo-1,5-alpha-L-arabinosidase